MSPCQPAESAQDRDYSGFGRRAGHRDRTVHGERQGVVGSIPSQGGKASFHALDISDTTSMEALVADTAEQYGHIDVLVNNAANMVLKDGSIEEHTIEMWDAIFSSDLRGTSCMIKTVLPYVREDKRGTCNQHWRWRMLTKDCRPAVRPLQLHPPQPERNAEQRSPHSPGPQRHLHQQHRVEPLGQPTDIGYAYACLASDESAYVTGQIITVDGGLNSYSPTVAQFRAMGPRTW